MIFSEIIAWVLLALLLLCCMGWWTSHKKLRLRLEEKEKALAVAETRLEITEKLHREQDMEERFGQVAMKVMEERSAHFNRSQENQLRHLLEPFQFQINQFRSELDTRLKYDAGDRISLREQIRQMMELNRTLSDQANNLTNALRGQNKTQGNWGEMILESMLEFAGLQKNIHYFTQVKNRNQEGRTIQPDVIVRYPDKRAIVIDAKVSLVAYEKFCNAERPEEKETALRELVRSMKAHADGLFLRSYQDVGDSLDFVMMFVPVEGAYIAAAQADPGIWQYTYQKKVLLISPSNLIAAMKLIQDMWQKDAIRNNAVQIAERAGKMYDKLAGFTDTFLKAGSQIEKAMQYWEDANKQLQTGRGNLLAQAEQMRQLGIKNSKTLPEADPEDMD